MNKGEAGGTSAANELNEQIKCYLKDDRLDPRKIDVVVRAYADVQSLHSACLKKGLMQQNGPNMRHFVNGFNKGLSLFDFIDVGPGKERADNKIRG